MEKVVYAYSERARSIRVKITSELIKVSIPVGVTQTRAEQFVQQNWQAILAKQLKLKANKRTPTLISPEIPLQTVTFKVIVTPLDNVTTIRSQLKDGVLRILYPATLNIDDAQTYFWNSITYFLRKEAKRIFPQRTIELAHKYGFQVKDVKIQSSRSRWGSCTSQKNINLSYYLLLTTMHLVDYVILHELCHTVEMNHSTRFWDLLNSLIDGKAKLYRNELKQFIIPETN